MEPWIHLNPKVSRAATTSVRRVLDLFHSFYSFEHDCKITSQKDTYKQHDDHTISVNTTSVDPNDNPPSGYSRFILIRLELGLNNSRKLTFTVSLLTNDTLSFFRVDYSCDMQTDFPRYQVHHLEERA